MGRAVLAGSTAGAAVICVAALWARPATAPLVVLAGATGGIGVGAAARIAGRSQVPIEAEVQAAPEVGQVRRQQYEILYSEYRPSRRYVRYAFVACRGGRTVGTFEADLILAERRLYGLNVFVAEPHRKRGLGTALMVSAALVTGCSVVTSSGRTPDGAALCVRARPALKRHGVELRDDPP